MTAQTDAAPNPYLRTLLGALPGGGLTRSAATWPDPLFVGVGGRAGMPAPNLRWQERELPSVLVDSPEELTEVIIATSDPTARADRFGAPVSTLVVDTIDQVELFLAARQASMPPRAWWQALTTLPLHVVLLCHLRWEGDRLVLATALGDEAPAFVDLALALRSRVYREVGEDGTVLGQSFHRYAQARPDATCPWTVDHSGRLAWEMPLDFTHDGRRLLTSVGLAEVATLPGPAAPEEGPPVAAAPAPRAEPPSVAPEPAQAPQAEPEPAAPPTDEAAAGGEEGLPLCANCEREGRTRRVESAEQRDVTSLRHREPLCKECGDAAWAALGRAAAPSVASAAPPAAQPARDPAEEAATVPRGEPVGRIPDPSDPDLRAFLRG